MSKFTQAVAKAKKLYKTGRYKTFAAAVKAAYKKGKTTVKKRVGSKVGKKAVGKKIGSGDSVVRTKPNKKNHAKSMLAKALLDYELADTIRATKEAQVRKIKWRKTLKSLSK
jgi:hypothetical protein